MKKRILLIVLYLSTFVQGWCQSEIYYVEDFYTRHTIVREYQQKLAVAYSYHPSTSGFCLIDFSSLTATYAELPSSVVVNDLEITGHTAYFCGTYAGIPYLGHFDIPTLFNGSGDFYFHRLAFSPPTYEIVAPEKLALYSVGGETHAVMVGAGRHNYATESLDERFVMDVYHDTPMPGPIAGSAIFNNTTPEHFYDIAVTDNFVVVISGKEDGNAHVMRAFDKPATAGGNIFASTTWHTYYHSQGDYFPVSQFLIAPMRGDKFATVCYSENSGHFGAAISTFQAPLTLLSRVVIDQGVSASAGCSLKEMAFNADKDILALLQDMTYPISATPTSAICQTDQYNNASAHYIPNYSFQSVTRWSNDGSVLASGVRQNGLFTLFWHRPAAEACHIETPLNTLPITSQDFKKDLYWTPQSFRSMYVTAAPTLSTYKIINGCN